MDKYYRALVKNAQGEKITVLVIKDSGLYLPMYINKKCFHLGKKTKNLSIAIELAKSFSAQYKIIRERITSQKISPVINSNHRGIDPVIAMVNQVLDDGTYELLDLSNDESIYAAKVLPFRYSYKQPLKIMECVYVFKGKSEIVGRA